MKTVFFAVAFVCGCGASVSTTATTSAEIPGRATDVSQEQAIRDIATIRCTRELSCGSIGDSAMGSCERDAREATRDALIVRSCPGGIDPGELSTCLESIRNASCGTAEALEDRLASCADVKLCR